MCSFIKRALLAFALLLAAAACGAADMYTWKDEAGRTHVAESVPGRYKRVAKKIDSGTFDVQGSERAAALARSAKERERAATLAAERERAEAAAPESAVGVSASQPNGTSSARPGESRCDQLWRAYFESQSCFAPYQRRDVGPRQEAYERCQTVQAPPAECGPAKVLPGN